VTASVKRVTVAAILANHEKRLAALEAKAN